MRSRAASVLLCVVLAVVAGSTAGPSRLSAWHDRLTGFQTQAPQTFLPTEPPVRLVDTRPGGATVDGQQSGLGPIQAGSVLNVPIAGRAGLPVAGWAVLNVTVVDARAPGFVTLFACDVPRPLASNVNFVIGTTRASLAVVALDSAGAACVYAHGETDVVIDVAGTFADGDIEGPPAPVRLLDTRPDGSTVDGLSSGGGRLARHSPLPVDVAGRGGLAQDGGAIVMTITVVNPATDGWAVAFTCGRPPDRASTLNFLAGQTVANMAVAHTDENGDVCVLSSAETDVIIDASGSLAAHAAGLTPEPRRVMDTRVGAATSDRQFQGHGLRVAGSTTELPVAGRGGVPADVGAVIVNVTAVAADQPGFIALHAGGTDWPGDTSNLNFEPGAVVANAAVIPIGGDGHVCLMTTADVHLVVDVVGWLPTTTSAPGAGCPSDPLFPSRRIVALYGNDVAAALGVLGEQPPDAAATRLAEVAAPYRVGDRPVQGAFELIATIATSFPGGSGLYRSPSSDAQVQRYLDAADANGLLLILDIQPGRGDFLTELQRYDQFLRRPNVHVALDPEWHVGPGEIPGQVVGQVDATTVNAVAEYLAGLVAEEGLSEKLLVVHQFQDRMLTNRHLLREPPGVALTIHMDGFGTRQQKLNTYGVVAASPPLSNGFKLFYDEDVNIFQPSEVLALDPVPDLITYQ